MFWAWHHSWCPEDGEGQHAHVVLPILMFMSYSWSRLSLITNLRKPLVGSKSSHHCQRALHSTATVICLLCLPPKVGSSAIQINEANFASNIIRILSTLVSSQPREASIMYRNLNWIASQFQNQPFVPWYLPIHLTEIVWLCFRLCLYHAHRCIHNPMMGWEFEHRFIIIPMMFALLNSPSVVSPFFSINSMSCSAGIWFRLDTTCLRWEWSDQWKLCVSEWLF